MTEALRLTRHLDAPRGSVFAAWTNPVVMREWLFASDEGDIVEVRVDPVVGGRFSIVERNDDTLIDHYGVYVAVEADRRLTFTLDVPQHFAESTEVDVELHEENGGCRIDFVQTGIDPAKTRPFWETMLDQLAEVVQDGSTGAAFPRSS